MVWLSSESCELNLWIRALANANVMNTARPLCYIRSMDRHGMRPVPACNRFSGSYTHILLVCEDGRLLRLDFCIVEAAATRACGEHRYHLRCSF